LVAKGFDGVKLVSSITTCTLSVVAILLFGFHYRRGIARGWRRMINGCGNYCIFLFFFIRGEERAQTFMDQHVNGSLWSWKRPKAKDPVGDIVNNQPQGTF